MQLVSQPPPQGGVCCCLCLTAVLHAFSAFPCLRRLIFYIVVRVYGGLFLERFLSRMRAYPKSTRIINLADAYLTNFVNLLKAKNLLLKFIEIRKQQPKRTK